MPKDKHFFYVTYTLFALTLFSPRNTNLSVPGSKR